LFELTEEEQMIRDTAREYARGTLTQRAVDYDRSEEFPHENYKELGELGFMGMLVDEEHGGSGLGSFALALMLEEVAYSCAATAITLGVHNSLVTAPIMKYGTAGQKKKYLPALASGEKIGAYCVTEPDVGSDAASIKTTAVKKGGTYIINGTKSWITSGGVAGVLIVFARSIKDADKPYRGLSAFIAEPGFKGFSVGKDEKKLGIRASNTTQLIFEDMEVPAENLLREEGKGFHTAMEFLDAGRIGVAAQAVGIAQACLDESVKYSKERKQFGKFISEFQAIQVKLANTAMEIEASRLLAHQASSSASYATQR
jgi:alkylation response protein AidB-like acyl-CoA dehydrogenase